MNIIFPRVDANFIKSKVEDGYYANATELVRDAVRRLREEENEKHKRLMNALNLGLDDIREGRTLEYSPELLEQIDAEAVQHAAEGRAIDPDVYP